MSADTGANAGADRKARAFLSYSRKDKDFTRKLALALTELGYVADFDRSEDDPANIETGISAEDDWWKRLQDMIAAAEAMVLIVSPNSAASPVCGEEIAYARALGKRVIPVLLSPIDFDKAPPRLAALNVKLSFTQEAAFEASLAELAAVLDVDVAWHREGARLSALAVTWDSEGQPDTRLLAAGAVSEAESWAARRPANAPPAGEPLISFLGASRAKSEADRERLLTITGRAFVKPAEQALAEGNYDAALRLAAAGTLLGEDHDMRLVPERTKAIVAAAFHTKLRAVVSQHVGQSRHLWFSPDGRRFATSHINEKIVGVWNAHHGGDGVALKGYTGKLLTAAFSPDGSLLATKAERDNAVRVWDCETGQARSVLGGTDRYEKLSSFSPDGKHVITLSGDKTARVWDAESGKEALALRCEKSSLSTAAFSPNGAFVAAASYDEPCARVWRASDGHEIATLRGILAGTHQVSFSNDGTRIITASRGTVQVWDSSDGVEIKALRQQWEGRFSPAGDRIVTVPSSAADGSNDNVVRVWEVSGGREVAALRGHSDYVNSAEFSPDGTRIVTASRDGTARIWDAEEGREIVAFRGHDGWVQSAAFSSDGHHVRTISGLVVRMWDAACRREIAILRGHRRYEEEVWAGHRGDVPVVRTVNNARFSPDGEHVVTEGPDSVRVWSASGQQVAMVEGAHQISFTSTGGPIVLTPAPGDVHVQDAISKRRIASLEGGNASGVFFGSHGGRVVSVSADHAVHVWESRTGRKLAVLRGHEGDVRVVEFSSDGTRILTAANDKTIRVWDCASGMETAAISGPAAARCVSFSSDGKRIAAGFWNSSTAHVWDAGTGRELLTLSGHTGDIVDIAFSPTGARVVMASWDKTASVWDVLTGRRLCTIGSNASLAYAYPNKVVFSPDELRVLSVTGDVVQVWDAERGREIAALRGHTENIRSAVFSPDGGRIVTTSDDATARIWDVNRTKSLTGDPVEILAASLSSGRGEKTDGERSDLIMQSAPDDLYGALMEQLTPEQRENVGRRVEILTRPLHRNCYLPASNRTDFTPPAEKEPPETQAAAPPSPVGAAPELRPQVDVKEPGATGQPSKQPDKHRIGAWLLVIPVLALVFVGWLMMR